jgi:hypothetical protein
MQPFLVLPGDVEESIAEQLDDFALHAARN